MSTSTYPDAVFGKARYQRVVRKEGKRLFISILRVAPRIGASSRFARASTTAAAWMSQWPVGDQGSVNPTAGAAAVRAFAWWLIYQGGLIVDGADQEEALRVANGLVPDAATGLLILGDESVVDDEQVVAPLTILLTGRAPESWDPSLWLTWWKT